MPDTKKRTSRMTTSKIAKIIDEIKVVIEEQNNSIAVSTSQSDKKLEAYATQVAELQETLIRLAGEWNKELSILRAGLSETIRRVDQLTPQLPVAQQPPV